MAGHNKWSSIKHKKAKTDAQKGKAFGKVSREIMVAARQGGADPDMNPALRLALQKAKQVNMPKENVERAVEKGAGAGDGGDLEQLTYEAYGPGGVAILIDVLTDNKNRSASNVRSIVDKHGGSMASPGAVGYLFSLKGVFVFGAEVDAEQVMDVALENGAEDIDEKEDGKIEILSEPDQFHGLVTAFEDANLEAEVSMLTRIASSEVALDADGLTKLERLEEALDEDDDVQELNHNGVPEE